MNESSKGLVSYYGEGGLQNESGGYVKFYPYVKGGPEKALAMLKLGTGAQQVLGQLLRSSLRSKFSHIEGGARGRKSFNSLKRGAQRFYPFLLGSAKSFGPVNFRFCSSLFL